MIDLPDCVTRGDRARLFPILAERSIEGRTLSIFLATLVQVRPFAELLLDQLGHRMGPRSRLAAYTEVCFKNQPADPNHRPDGLLIIDTGRSRWSALVEAKVKKNEIETEQLKRYLKIAKENNIDAVVTLSNQFSLAPHHHPNSISPPKGIELFHISWMRVLTDAYLLTGNDFQDDSQFYILKEFKRFISHESAGVESFTQMPPIWSTVAETIQTGGNLLVADAKELVTAWHQECQDLSLIFSRQIDAGVTQKLSRAEADNPAKLIQAAADYLRDCHRVKVTFDVPNAASPVFVEADFDRRTISISMYLSPPGDKKRNVARLNWLLQQLPDKNLSGYYVRAQWPGRSPWTQMPLAEASHDPSPLFADKGKMDLIGFEIVRVVDLGHRFSKPRVFIEELEKAVPDFYENVGQNLTAWIQPAPRLKENRLDPETVSPSAISSGS